MKHFINLCAIMLPAIIAAGCSEEVINPDTDDNGTDIVNVEDLYSGNANIIVNSEFRLDTLIYSTAFVDQVVKEQLSNQHVDFKFDTDKKNITLTFMPRSVLINMPNGGSQNVYNPSVFTLYDTQSISFPIYLNNNSLNFGGTFHTQHYVFDIEGTIEKASTPKTKTIANNNLTISIKSKKLKNTYDWNTSDVFVTRRCLDDFDYIQCGGFHCTLPDDAIPGLEKYDITSTEFFNIFFNLAFVYVDTPHGNTVFEPCINNMFNNGALKFLESGELVSGTLGAREKPVPSHGNGGIEYPGVKGIIDLTYEPSAVLYLPVSKDRLKLYVNSDMTSPEFTKRNGLYATIWSYLYNSLSSELANGLGMQKTTVETLPDGDQIFMLSFDEAVSKKMMNAFINILKEKDNKVSFVQKFPKIRPGKYEMTESELTAAVNALPEIINNTPTLQLGIQICLPRDRFNPYH